MYRNRRSHLFLLSWDFSSFTNFFLFFFIFTIWFISRWSRWKWLGSKWFFGRGWWIFDEGKRRGQRCNHGIWCKLGVNFLFVCSFVRSFLCLLALLSVECHGIDADVKDVGIEKCPLDFAIYVLCVHDGYFSIDSLWICWWTLEFIHMIATSTVHRWCVTSDLSQKLSFASWT